MNTLSYLRPTYFKPAIEKLCHLLLFLSKTHFMKKLARYTLILLLLIVVTVLILAVVEPTSIPVTRTIIIKAPKDVVFDQIVKFKNWPNWNPWQRYDSAMKTTYQGTDGQPGSGFSWEGNDKVGTGEMKDSAVNGTQMVFVMNMLKPMKNSAAGYLKTEDTAGMTRVTWEMTAHMPFPMNAMDAFMNMDKLLGADFEAGLSNMKQYIESHSAASTGDIEVKEADYPAHIFEGMRGMVNWADMTKFFANSYSLLGKDIGTKINGPGTGLFFVWDTVNKRADMAAVFPVSDTTMPVKGATFMYAGPAKAVMAVQKGGYSTSMKYHNAIMSYMAARGQQYSIVIEEYAVTSHDEPDSNKWVTNIYYLEK
jgi:hypothetical protein